MLKLYLELAEKHPHWVVIKCVDSKGKLLTVEKVHEKVITAIKKFKIV